MLFLDGKKALSADVSDAKGLRDLKLHLVGTWGKKGRLSISTTSRSALHPAGASSGFVGERR